MLTKCLALQKKKRERKGGKKRRRCVFTLLFSFVMDLPTVFFLYSLECCSPDTSTNKHGSKKKQKEISRKFQPTVALADRKKKLITMEGTKGHC